MLSAHYPAELLNQSDTEPTAVSYVQLVFLSSRGAELLTSFAIYTKN